MLADVAVCNAKAAERPYKLPDRQGLNFLVTTTGGQSWRIDYRFNGKRRTAAFGLFPDVSLVDARNELEAARKELGVGIDPGAEVELPPPIAIFEAVARQWHVLNTPR